MKQPIAEWRMRGRAFDPRRDRTSRGEQQSRAIDALINGGTGVAAGALILIAIAYAVAR